MRRFLIGLAILSVSVCSFGEPIDKGDIEKNPILKGKILAKRCAWCHDINRTLVAPPFKVILYRYKDIPDDTLKKQFFISIKDGSKGKWNKWLKENASVKLQNVENMYMPPQKPYYTDDDIKLIVDWLLSLRKK